MTGKLSVEDAPRSDRPRETVTSLNVATIKNLLSIQQVVSISTGSINTILHTEICARKVCSKWVPRTLSEKNKKESAFRNEDNKVLVKSTDGIVASNVVKQGQTVNGWYYGDVILPEVFKNFKEISSRSTVRDIILHHDNAAPHKAIEVTEYLQLGGLRFERIQELARAVKLIADNISKEDYLNCFQDWLKRLRRCIDVNGNYFEGMNN
ncbi:15365_t:CDS:2 [Gigaspora margarita]|uniref:15365_t:CDS:1 n=1 Tax=Gigaspora margarita TaxID=4874 RepID=A0ABN7UF19_GIGMA|nr:15365_t:CDS:2 [Gigaspora margarita]